MGDRYYWQEPCPKCKEMLDVGYAESCGITSVTCPNCKIKFEVVLDFKLIPFKEKQKHIKEAADE
jgi:hypothetical protein